MQRRNIFFIAILALFVILAGGFAAYQFSTNRTLAREMAMLESSLNQEKLSLASTSETLASTTAALEGEASVAANDEQALRSIAASGNRRTPAVPNSGSASTASEPSSLTGAVERTAPAVVSIVISKDVQGLDVRYVNPFGDDPNFQGFGFQIPVYSENGSTTREKIAAGTGFFVRSDGYILTNKHVTSDPEAYYTVLLSTGKQIEAKVVYRDPSIDIALLKVAGTGYPTAKFGDSSKLKLGESVAAIGNALGEYNNTVSVGVVSGLDRSIEAYDENGDPETLDGVIQTDAAINPGNSGGPLIDYDGNVIGINVATAEGASGIGFAIPANDIVPAVNRALSS